MAKSSIIKKLDQLAQSQAEMVEDMLSRESKHQHGTTWSAHQVLQHIASSQAGTLKVLARKKEKGEYKEIPFSHKVNFLLLRIFFAFNLKTTAPSVLPIPDESNTLKDLQLELRQQHTTLAQAIKELDKSNLQKAIFRHPITGLMNARMTVQFLGLHWQHHKKQILTRLQ